MKCSSLILVIFFVVGCATTKKNYQDIRNLTSKKEYTKAIELVSSDDFYPKEESSLLKFLELGTLHYFNGEFYQSLKALDQAKDLSDKLFTKSLSKKISSSVLSDNMDNYYGERYERSLIRFFEVLVNFTLYKNGEYEAYKIEKKNTDKKEKEYIEIPAKKLSLNERRTHLFAARAHVLEWDSLLSTYVNDSLGEETYKVDLAAKIFGAFIHEEIGTRSDLQIARQLYLDAKTTIFRYYNNYPSFNKRYKDFSSQFKKLASMKESEIQKKYIEETTFAKSLLAFIDGRLKDLKNGNKDNVKILLLNDYIAQKQPKVIKFPLPVAKISVDLSSTSREEGLMTPLQFTSYLLGVSAGVSPEIKFELPMVEEKKLDSTYSLVVLNGDKEVFRKELSLINPLSNIAYNIMDHKVIGTYARIGARIALKYVAAIVSAYTIYKNKPGIIGQGLAMVSYLGASKAIEESEKADLRFWSTLPDSIFFSSFYLKPGDYSYYIEEKQGSQLIRGETNPLKVGNKENEFIHLKI